MKTVVSLNVLNTLLYNNGVLSDSYFFECPFKTFREGFESSNKCKTTCPHCGDIEKDAEGNKRVFLTCGCGTEIREEEFVPPSIKKGTDV